MARLIKHARVVNRKKRNAAEMKLPEMYTNDVITTTWRHRRRLMFREYWLL